MSLKILKIFTAETVPVPVQSECVTFSKNKENGKDTKTAKSQERTTFKNDNTQIHTYCIIEKILAYNWDTLNYKLHY